MLLDMKVTFNKDLFKLINTLAGEPICCSTCKNFSSPANAKCLGPLTYYEHWSKDKKHFQLLSFCENYERDKNGTK